MTLDEIVEEGERLEVRSRAEGFVVLADELFRVKHFPALLAVAKAGATMRSFIAADTSDPDPGDTLGWNEMIAAWDAAAKGEK